MKRLKAVYASNFVSSLTNFLNIALTAARNQITVGTGTTTTISAPTPAVSQVVTIPDSGTASTNVWKTAQLNRTSTAILNWPITH
jgi:hypothetical protein